MVEIVIWQFIWYNTFVDMGNGLSSVMGKEVCYEYY